MYIIFYFIALVLSFLLLVLLVSGKSKPNISFVMTFISVVIANFGYCSIAWSKSVGEAVLANRIVYFGTVFLCFFIMMSIAEVCGTNIHKVWIGIMMIINLVMLGISWSVGELPIYYSNQSISTSHGATVIVKEYGPLHTWYRVFLMIYLIGMLLFVARSFGKRRSVSYKYSYLLILVVAVDAAVYILRDLVGMDFEMVSYGYVFSCMILLYIQHRMDLYDPRHVLDGEFEFAKKGAIILDNNLHYMGCSSGAKTIVPDLETLNLEYPIGKDAPATCRELLSWIEDFQRDSTDSLHFLEDENGIFRCEVRRYTSHRKRNLGYVMFLSDDTAQQKYIQSLNEYNEELRQKEEELKTLNSSLENAVNVAHRACEAKSDFLSRMSHDIRTPMNGIIGMTRIAKQNIRDGEKVADCLEKINLASDHLLALINDILDVTKMEAGKFDLSKEPFDLLRVLKDVEVVMSDSAVNAGLTLAVNSDKLKHPYVIGSALNVKRVIMNLVSNAIKYNKRGGSVDVSVYEKIIEGGDREYVFTIKDTGIGMSDDFLQHIFEPFSRENEGPKAKADGTGLGMTIVKNLTELMGGTVWVESKLGEGSCFEVTIPLEVDANPTGGLSGTTQAVDLEGMKILLVEDNELNLEIATYMLEDAGGVVTTALDGQAALQIFADNPPGTFDIILMDIMMPIMDGYTASREIRNMDRPDAKEIPIIAMTANAFSDDVQKAKQAGMNAHIAKPLDVDKMFAVIESYH